jgi:hypothetical protein
MALSWEQYRFRRLRFHYIPRAPSTTPGSLQVSPDYDAQDGQPVTEQQLTQNRDTVENNPWEVLVCTLKPASMNRAYKSHFVMSDPRFSSTNQDEKTIDAAQLFIAADSDGASNWGKLWVEYEVELSIPQTPVITTAEDGALVGVSSGLPVVAGQSFSNTASSVTLVQNIEQPLVKAVENGSVPSSELVEFLRDWSGRASFIFNGTTGQATSMASYPGIYLDGQLQGSSPADQRLSFTSGVANNFFANNSGGFTNFVKTVDIVAKAGQKLGITPGGLPSSFSASDRVTVVNLLLGAASQFN